MSAAVEEVSCRDVVPALDHPCNLCEHKRLGNERKVIDEVRDLHNVTTLLTAVLVALKQRPMVWSCR